MPITDQELFKMFVLLKRPIHWDPIPPWVRVKPEVLEKFNATQTRLNAKLTQLESEKVAELGKMIGLPMG